MRREPAVVMTQHAGARASRVNRLTGTVVTIYDAVQADIDPEGGRWTTVCEDHDTLVNHPTLADARYFMAHVTVWCEECQQLERAGEKVKV